MNPLIAISIYLTSLVALVIGVGWVSTKVNLSPECRRKAVHVGMGLATLTFPLVFDSVAPAVFLALLSVSVLLLLRCFPSLKCSDSIHGVSRRTGGDFYFVVGVLGAFILVGDYPVYYSIAVLTLTFADPAAAFVGQTLGSPVSMRKTTVGSIAFFVVAFACVFVPLAAFQPSPTTLLIALSFAISVTCIEALSTRGSDNLTIPVAGSVFLLLSPPFQWGFALAAISIFSLLHERHRLTTSARSRR